MIPQKAKGCKACEEQKKLGIYLLSDNQGNKKIDVLFSNGTG